MYWNTMARSIHASRLSGMKMNPKSGTKAIRPSERRGEKRRAGCTDDQREHDGEDAADGPPFTANEGRDAGDRGRDRTSSAAITICVRRYSRLMIVIHATKPAVTSAVTPQPSPAAAARADERQESHTGGEIHAHQAETQPRVHRKQRARPVNERVHRERRRLSHDVGQERRVLDGTRLALAAHQHADGSSFDQEDEQRAAGDDHAERGQQRHQHQRLRQQRRDDGGGQIPPLERHQRHWLRSDHQGDEKDPADERRGDEQLEQRIGDGLDDRQRPVGGRHERAALQRELDGGERHGGPLNGTSPPAKSPIYNDVVRLSPADASLPPLPWRTLARIAAGGLICALLVLAGGWALRRAVFGRDESQARARVEAEVRSTFDAMSRQLRDMAAAVADPALVRAAADDDTSAVHRLLTRAAEVVGDGDERCRLDDLWHGRNAARVGWPSVGTPRRSSAGARGLVPCARGAGAAPRSTCSR